MATTERTGFAIDLSDLKLFADQLKEVEPRLYRNFRNALVEGADVVAERAREIAGEHSSSIPGTVKVRANGIKVYVEAGGDGTPLAGLYEVGNAKGGRYASSSRGSFRHPVFGNSDVWVTQAGYPFLRPALEQTEAALIENVRFAVDVAIREVIRNQ